MLLTCCDRWVLLFFFFKHKTAYEVRMSDWSSDVCSSDLGSGRRGTRSVIFMARTVRSDERRESDSEHPVSLCRAYRHGAPGGGGRSFCPRTDQGSSRRRTG